MHVLFSTRALVSYADVHNARVPAASFHYSASVPALSSTAWPVPQNELRPLFLA